MKNSKIIFFALIFVFAGLSSLQQANAAACNAGHESSGNQSWGGPNGRWEIVCDKTTPVVCCVSHPSGGIQ